MDKQNRLGLNNKYWNETLSIVEKYTDQTGKKEVLERIYIDEASLVATHGFSMLVLEHELFESLENGLYDIMKKGKNYHIIKSDLKLAYPDYKQIFDKNRTLSGMTFELEKASDVAVMQAKINRKTPVNNRYVYSINPDYTKPILKLKNKWELQQSSLLDGGNPIILKSKASLSLGLSCDIFYIQPPIRIKLEEE